MRKKDDLWMGFLVIAGIPLLLILEYPFELLIILIAIALIIVLALLIKNSEGPRRLKKANKLSAATSKSEIKIGVYNQLEIIDAMKGSEFETFVVELLKCNGFSNVSQTKLSGDFGVDVIGFKDNKKYVFQCKRFKGKLGLKPIQEAYAGKRHYRADEAVVVTNSEFTKAAMELASDTDIICCDRNQLTKLLENYVILKNNINVK
ncbi:MAG: restriction endonuclease [Ruminococcaceae bacterium]|nr:restriction endonuclease [Oscillospiraceae bacterium]